MSGQDRTVEAPNSPGIPSESYRSPERRLRSSVQASPRRFSTPLTGIKLTIIDLKMSQQANVSFSSARCGVSIDQRTKTFESSQYVLNDKKYEIQFNFNPSLDYDYFRISPDWKRITARLEVHGQSHVTGEAVYIDAMGVSNVPYATEWNTSERNERWSGVVGIAMISGNSKIGEVRVLIETQLEGFFEDSASEDGDYSATPSPMTPGRANPRYTNVSMALSSSIKSPIRREIASPVQLKWDPASAVKNSVQEYSRSLQNSPAKSPVPPAGAASPSKYSLMSPNRGVSQSLMDTASPRPPPPVTSVVPATVVASEPAAGALLDDDEPPEIEEETVEEDVVTTEVPSSSGSSVVDESNNDDTPLINAVQEIVESGRTDDDAVLAALDAVLENIHSNPGSPRRTLSHTASFSSSSGEPPRSPVRTATVTSYSHTLEGELVYAAKPPVAPVLKSAATSPMVPERVVVSTPVPPTNTPVNLSPAAAAAPVLVDAATSPAVLPSQTPEKPLVSTVPAHPLTPIQESEYSDGQTSFTTTPINGGHHHAALSFTPHAAGEEDASFSSGSLAVKSPLIDQFASVSASAALLPETSVDLRSGLTSEAESVQSEEPYNHHATSSYPPNAAVSETSSRFLRSTPHKRRPVSEGGYGGRGYRSAEEERRSNLVPAVSLSLFYMYFVVTLIAFGCTVFPEYGVMLRSLWNLNVSAPSQAVSTHQLSLPIKSASKSSVSSTSSAVVPLTALHLSSTGTPQGVRVQLKDRRDSSCLVWTKGPWWKGGGRAEFQPCNDNSWWIILPTEANEEAARDLRIQHASSGLCLSANTCRSGKYNTNRREALKLRSCDAPSNRCGDNWRLDHNYLGRGLRSNWERIVPGLTSRSQSIHQQQSSVQSKSLQRDESGRLVSFAHPMCLGREKNAAYLIPCAAASIDNSTYKNTELISVLAVSSTMTSSRNGRLGVETVELDTILSE